MHRSLRLIHDHVNHMTTSRGYWLEVVFVAQTSRWNETRGDGVNNEGEEVREK